MQTQSVILRNYCFIIFYPFFSFHSTTITMTTTTTTTTNSTTAIICSNYSNICTFWNYLLKIISLGS